MDRLEKTQCLDVTDRRPKDLIGVDNLPELLKLIKTQRLWSKKATWALYSALNNKPITLSNTQSFKCPVRPLAGPLRLKIGEGDDGPKLTWIADSLTLHPTPFGGDYYFKSHENFETDERKRGFTCITYVGAVRGVDVQTLAMSGNGKKLADHLAPNIPNDKTDETQHEIKEFFKPHTSGSYIMWQPDHTVLVVNGTVYEFCQSGGGFRDTPAQEWNYGGASYCVRKLG